MKKIVICDDDPKSLRDLRIVFNTNKSKIVKEFNNGMDILNWFKEHSSEVDLIVLDIIMPRMDGFTVYFEIKKINPSIPVIIFTVENSAPLIKYLMFMGIKDYITKPYDLEQLKKKVLNYL